jgi:hypothetical protein
MSEDRGKEGICVGAGEEMSGEREKVEEVRVWVREICLYTAIQRLWFIS